jgi:hypothetical protein
LAAIFEDFLSFGSQHELDKFDGMEGFCALLGMVIP